MSDDRCNEAVQVFDMKGSPIMHVACDHVGKHMPSDQHSACLQGRRLIGTDVTVCLVWPQERKARVRRK